ncbi:hypothetical protein [Anaerotruncus massiliensis (ex Togo et al. 2019)]|uniref:hypothetical protein n=1 Tax=Anaerotruncus massiliensis (ex Togo et al. 2019) TaxID=1673720 RepID=UPI0027BAA86A|nr:hypothetical protein [Anaerotruncus massiliensis (ex Togo et al. 2019)]
MKRLLAALLAAALAGSLAACGGEPAREPVPPVSSMELPGEPEAAPPAPEPEPVPPAPESAPEEAPPAGSVPSAEAVSTPPAAPAAALPDGFNFTAGPDSGVFLCGGVRVNGGSVYRYSDQVAVGSSWETPFHLQKLEPEPADEIGERLSDFDVLILELEDDTKYTYTFYTEGLEVAKSLPAADAGEPVRYRVDPKAYAELIGLERVRMGEGLWFPSWLRVIRKSRVTGIAFRSSDGESETVYLPDDERFDWALSGLDISVRPGSAERVGRESRLEGAARIDIDFATGIRYRVEVNETALLVAASDMDHALRYPLKHEDTTLRELDDIAAGKMLPLTGKPVVYLYPERLTDVSVRVDYRGSFSETIPAYRDGWEVTAHPGGALVDRADGRSYPYLFWEGNTPVDWDFSEGFCVAGADTERFLREKLALLGLNAGETAEFLDYWLPEMQQNACNLITFSTEQYERLAPMEISPAPDSLLRVHMVYRGLDAPRPIRAQELEGGFVRRGFTVVEWGGSRA